MSKISYHNFTFPFQWCIKETEKKTLSEQINLDKIQFNESADWRHATTAILPEDKNVLYDEKNYFYKFIHDALYDTDSKTKKSLMRHFERLIPEEYKNDAKYTITVKRGDEVRSYELTVAAINLNLYSTGVGVLSFYLYNEKYPNLEDILTINQKGRRIFPPYIKSVEDRKVIAESITIEITNSSRVTKQYKEDFIDYKNDSESNTPAKFIEQLILEVASNVKLEPVVDDRMFVQCWYKNDEWTSQFKEYGFNNFINSDEWYEFVFVDELNEISCLNRDMRRQLIEKATYKRWQLNGSLVGICRNAFVYLTNNTCPQNFLTTFESMYARMAELIIIQKASVLRFSVEIANINRQKEKYFSEKVNSLYKEYIRFVNQFHFREITAQTPGIEIYQMLYDAFGIDVQVNKLHDEIEELHNYATLQEENKTNSTMTVLTRWTTILLPITVVAGIFGMNNVASNGENKGELHDWWNSIELQFAIILAATAITILLLFYLNRTGKK